MVREKTEMNKKNMRLAPCEERIQETICKSKAVFYYTEQEQVLSYPDFLLTQFHVIQKRWWGLQFLLLILLWIALDSIQEQFYLERSMGVAGTIFVILIIPELWKSRSCECMEIEAASYYSLRQVYASRMFLFGVIDVLLITMFLGGATAGFHVALTELVIQFLFPLSVTACICFGVLCSKYCFSESIAIILCVIWSAVWLFIVLNEDIYALVTVPVWYMLVGVAILFLVFSVYRILGNCDHYLEVATNEIGTS